MISPATTLALKSKHNNSAHLLVSAVLLRAQSHSVFLWDALLQIPALLTNSTVRGSGGDGFISHIITTSTTTTTTTMNHRHNRYH